MAAAHQVPVAAAPVPVVQERAARALAAQEPVALVQAVALAAVRVADPAAVGAAAEVAVANNLVTEKAPVQKPQFTWGFFLFSSFNLASRIASHQSDPLLWCGYSIVSTRENRRSGVLRRFSGRGVHVPPEWHLDNRELHADVPGNQSLFAGLNPRTPADETRQRPDAHVFATYRTGRRSCSERF
jgi:hypothetical protein